MKTTSTYGTITAFVAQDISDSKIFYFDDLGISGSLNLFFEPISPDIAIIEMNGRPFVIVAYISPTNPLGNITIEYHNFQPAVGLVSGYKQEFWSPYPGNPRVLHIDANTNEHFGIIWDNPTNPLQPLCIAIGTEDPGFWDLPRIVSSIVSIAGTEGAIQPDISVFADNNSDNFALFTYITDAVYGLKIGYEEIPDIFSGVSLNNTLFSSTDGFYRTPRIAVPPDESITSPDFEYSVVAVNASENLEGVTSFGGAIFQNVYSDGTMDDPCPGFPIPTKVIKPVVAYRPGGDGIMMGFDWDPSILFVPQVPSSLAFHCDASGIFTPMSGVNTYLRVPTGPFPDHTGQNLAMAGRHGANDEILFAYKKPGVDLKWKSVSFLNPNLRLAPQESGPIHGITESETIQKGLEVFPKIFRDKLNIASPSEIKGTFSLFDPLGRAIMQGNFSGNTTFQTGFLKPGIYFLSISEADNGFQKSFLVKKAD